MINQPYVRRLHAVLPSMTRSAEEIDEWIGESPGYTRQTSGVATRHVAGEAETVAVMGARAVSELVKLENLTFDDIDALVFASASKDQFLPSSAALVAHQLGDEANGVPAFDIDSSCLSFLLAVDLMGRAMASGMYERIVVVSSEKPSTSLHPKFKEAAGLFGDAAVACLLDTTTPPSPSDGGYGFSKVLHAKYETWAEGAHDTEVKIGTSYNPNTDYHDLNMDDCRFVMNGPRIYRLAAKTLPSFLDGFLADLGMSSLDDFDFVVPHQASKSAVELLARKMKVPAGKYAQDYRRYGNTVAASIPLSLLRALEEGRIGPGDRVLLVGTAAGFTLGAMAIEI